MKTTKDVNLEKQKKQEESSLSYSEKVELLDRLVLDSITSKRPPSELFEEYKKIEMRPITKS
jgi:hypothetical protein